MSRISSGFPKSHLLSCEAPAGDERSDLTYTTECEDPMIIEPSSLCLKWLECLQSNRTNSESLGHDVRMSDISDSLNLPDIIDEIHRIESGRLIRRAREIEKRRYLLGLHKQHSGFETDALAFRTIFDSAGLEPPSSAMKKLALSSGMHIEETWTTTPAETPGYKLVSLNPVTVFTLLRASIEMSSLGLWVLGPEPSNERVKNYASLVLYSQKRYWQALNSHSASRQPVADPPIAESELRKILADAGIEPSPMEPSSKLVKFATARNHAVSLAWTPLVSWKVASGIAHGIPWAIEETAKSTTDAANHKTTIRLDLESYHHVLAAAVHLFDRLVTRVEVLNGFGVGNQHPDSAKRW